METVELIVGVFEHSERANEVLTALKKLDRQKELELHNAAIVFKDTYGHTGIKDQGDVNTKRGAIFGAISGALLGILAGPAGIVIGATAGAATGGAAAHHLDLGFSNDLLENLKKALKLNHSLVMVTVDSEWGDLVAGTIDGYQGKTLRHSLKKDLLEKIIDAQN